jgi:hypothetical protein
MRLFSITAIVDAMDQADADTVADAIVDLPVSSRS